MPGRGRVYFYYNHYQTSKQVVIQFLLPARVRVLTHFVFLSILLLLLLAGGGGGNKPFVVVPVQQVEAMSTTATTTSSVKKGALIFLHGLGDTPAGWSSLERVLPSIQPRLKDIHYVFPSAPTIPISINGGMTMPGWFDLYDWPIGIKAKQDTVGLKRSVKQLKEIVLDLQTNKGIEPNRIILGGFSQGGAIALLTAYGYPIDGDDDDNNKAAETTSTTSTCEASSTAKCFAGCASLSGWIPTPDNWNIPLKTTTATKLFWAHGTFDDKVLFEQQSYGIERFEQMGLSSNHIQHEQYHMGHESNSIELEELAKFVDDVLFGTNEDSIEE